MAIVDDLFEQKLVREIVFEMDFERIARAVGYPQQHDIFHSQRKLGIHLAVYLDAFKEWIGKVIHSTYDEQHHYIGTPDK